MGFPGSSAGKESSCNAGDMGLIPGLERSPGEGKGYPFPVFWPGEFHGLHSPWGRKESDSTEQLSLVFLPGEFHGQRNLPGYSPWGCKESDVTNSFIFITYLDFFTNPITIIQW